MMDFACILQLIIGLVIAAASLLLCVSAVDGKTHPVLRWALIGLVCWGAWFAALPAIEGRHDSASAIALAALVAYVLVRHWRELAAILDGAWWWPPNNGNPWDVHLPARRKPLPWWKKLNPWWALFGNDDDGYWGDDPWRQGRPKTFWLAVQWWFRNPAHNLTWYVIGFADRRRLVSGRWVPRIHKPGGGFLWCYSRVWLGGRWRLFLPFVSYLSPHCRVYLGWRTGGAFGIKVNLSIKGRPEWVWR